MYKVVFYTDDRNQSEIVDYIEKLDQEALTNKDSRIKSNKIAAYIRRLERYGTTIGEPYIKHLEDNIWELRPLKDRMLFAYWKDNKFVILHHFIKKTKKTPPREIEQAKNKLKEFLERGDNNG